jgi:hypothetical protein
VQQTNKQTNKHAPLSMSPRYALCTLPLCTFHSSLIGRPQAVADAHTPRTVLPATTHPSRHLTNEHIPDMTAGNDTAAADPATNVMIISRMSLLTMRHQPGCSAAGLQSCCQTFLSRFTVVIMFCNRSSLISPIANVTSITYQQTQFCA